MTPAERPDHGRYAITITGNNFQTGATVQIGTAAATSVTVVNPMTLTCTAPSGSLGPKPVTVTNPDMGSGTLANGFTYVTPLVLTQVVPLVAAPGVTIVVTGSGFQTGATVLVGGMPVTPISINANQMTFANPASVACGGPIQVTNPNTQTASIAFNPAPTITTLIPAAGPAAGGNGISVIGTNFFTGSTVRVNGNVVPSTLLGTTLITLTMPAGSAGPVPVR